MERIDLTKPRFTQAQVLQLVPTLTAKDLQNWVQRGIIDVGNPAPGRQGKVLYTGVGVIALAFMSKLTKLSIGPRAANSMAERVVEHARHIHDVYPAKDEGGHLSWIIAPEVASVYHRGCIYKYQDEHVIYIYKDDLDNYVRVVLPDVYITIEIDFLVLSTLNRLYGLLAGMPPVGAAEDPASDERILEYLRFQADLGSPGSGHD